MCSDTSNFKKLMANYLNSELFSYSLPREADNGGEHFKQDTYDCGPAHIEGAHMPGVQK